MISLQNINKYPGNVGFSPLSKCHSVACVLMSKTLSGKVLNLFVLLNKCMQHSTGDSSIPRGNASEFHNVYASFMEEKRQSEFSFPAIFALI